MFFFTLFLISKIFLEIASHRPDCSSAKALGDSVFGGALILGLLLGAVVLVGGFDKIERRGRR